MNFSIPTRLLRQMCSGALIAGALMGVGVRAAHADGRRQGQRESSVKAAPQSERTRRASEVRTGVLGTAEGLRLRLVTDGGNVRILTGKPGEVRYRVRIETDLHKPKAESALKQYALSARSNAAGVQITGGGPERVWASYEITVPKTYSLDVLTQAGNIEVPDIEGRISLITQGGNISAGRIEGREGNAAAAGGPAARLETEGGHIAVQDVNGSLQAITAGGHIAAGNVQGDALLRSGGGHIRAGVIRGTATLETGGGNISVQSAGAGINVSTGGGQIDFGEVAGLIQARTGGGGIRIKSMTGPTRVETSGGSIVLTHVQNAVRATTTSGTITAWFVPEKSGESRKGIWKLLGASQLESGQGDITVYIPRDLAARVEASIEMAAEHRIVADPALSLKQSYQSGPSGTRSVKGECTLNGGGEVLRLKTVAGDIRLKIADADPDVRASQQEMMKQIEERLAVQKRRMQVQIQEATPEESDVAEHAVRAAEEAQRRAEEVQRRAEEAQQKLTERERSRFEELGRKLEEILAGGVRVDPEEQQQKLVSSVLPSYPDVAKQAGVEGMVRLRVVIGQDGAVQGIKVLDGEPVLVDAAVAAVKKWRYRPTLVNGRPVNVISTVTVRFKLR